MCCKNSLAKKEVHKDVGQEANEAQKMLKKLKPQKRYLGTRFDFWYHFFALPRVRNSTTFKKNHSYSSQKQIKS